MGLINKIKSALFNKDLVNKAGEMSEFDQVITASRIECAKENPNFWDVKLNKVKVYVEQVATWDDKKRIDLIVYCVQEMARFSKRRDKSESPEFKNNLIREAYVSHLLKTKLKVDEEALGRIVNTFIENNKFEWGTISQWPVSSLLNQLASQYKTTGLSDKMRLYLSKLKSAFENAKDIYGDKTKSKIIEKIDQLLFENDGSGLVKPTLFLGKDDFGTYANSSINSIPSNKQQIWYKLIAKAQKANGSKPTKKYLDETLVLVKELGIDNYRKVVNDWFLFVVDFKEKPLQHGNGAYAHTGWEFLSSINLDAIKGFVWMCAHFYDNNTLSTVSKLAERCFRKIPGHGPTAASLGNACLYMLYKSKGLDGIGHLSRLKLRIKQSSTQQLIEKYIAEAAPTLGVSTHEIEDMAVDDFKLVMGTRSYSFDEYSCILSITRVGKSDLQWIKPDGNVQKTLPSFVKEKHAAKLKKLKETQKQVDQTSSAQRDRIDRMFRTGRKLSYADFKRFYLDHGLLSVLAKKIIWVFTTETSAVSVLWGDAGWLTIDQHLVVPEENSTVSLWHPAVSTIEEVKNWRALLIDLKIQQPLKQAFREVYLLTDAEINTKSYSNRMASHVLKQHQFNMLAKTRGWKYALMGAFDNGYDSGKAEIQLQEYDLKAEYWVNEVNADNEFSDMGIWNYIATDQIRFVSTITNQVIDLIDVPALPLSEVLRDVDLFVGVASVGNDPTWRDSGGIPAYRDYWTTYSFGDLSEVAKNRKEILTGLVPRLKIGKVAEIKDKFLLVKGKLRTYKIHLGSTNILMEPNDQYLCIVPDRSQKGLTEDLFIPFEGDAGLSVILSKAFLLADDDKITDRTITSQINRK